MPGFTAKSGAPHPLRDAADADKAFVEVNEEGTEAAAATAVEMATKAILSYPVFRADHPFFSW